MHALGRPTRLPAPARGEAAPDGCEGSGAAETAAPRSGPIPRRSWCDEEHRLNGDVFRKSIDMSPPARWSGLRWQPHPPVGGSQRPDAPDRSRRVANEAPVRRAVGGPLYGGVELDGRYRLEEAVGRGAMGEVWRGVDRRLGRSVAVKILPPARRARPEQVERFRREARIAAALQHPGITVVHDVGEHNGLLYFVMEYLEGEDLAKVVRRNPEGLPIDRVLGFGIQLADALGAAHGRGVVHRDVKPANIMVTAFDRTKICDFGVARIVERIDGESGTRGIGTPLYTAPEQFEGRAGAQADLYSLGCVLYELLTGCPPFHGTPLELMRRHQSEFPQPVHTLRSDVPDELDALVAELLEKEPAKRPQDAQSVKTRLRDLRRRLREASAEREIAITPQTGGRPAPSGRRGTGEKLEPPPLSLLEAAEGLHAEEGRVSSEAGAVRFGDVLGFAPDADDRPLAVAIGRGDAGPLVADLASLPHLLIAGSVTAEKSAAVHAIVSSLLMRVPPDRVRMILVDSERAELSAYAGVPHLLTPVVTDAGSAIGALRWVEEEMERRYDDLAAHKCRDIDAYNEVMRNGGFSASRSGSDGRIHPRIVVVLEELNELMAISPQETEELVGRLARTARAVGIHLVLATRRVTGRVLPRRIRADIPSRLAFKMNSPEESDLVIERPGAERLRGTGDALYLPKGSSKPIEIRCASPSEHEIESIVDHWVVHH